MKSTQQGGVNLAVGDAFLGIYQGGQNAMPHINHFCFGIRDFDPGGAPSPRSKRRACPPNRARATA